MKQQLDIPDRDWMDSRVEAYLDGELPADEEAMFKEVLAADPYWRYQVDLADGIQATLRTLPQPECPSHVVDAIYDRTIKAERKQRVRDYVGWWREVWLDVRQPALAMAVLLTIVVGTALFGTRSPTQQESAEVRQALEDARWAMAFLAEVGRNTGSAIRDDILQEHVISPMHDAVGSALSPHNEDSTQD